MTHGFQFTPFGITALGDASNGSSEQMPAAILVQAPVEDEESDRARPAVKAASAQKPIAKLNGAPVSPKTVIKAARARVKELRAELKRVRSLEKELAELERLLAAAARPVASVANLNSRRAS